MAYSIENGGSDHQPQAARPNKFRDRDGFLRASGNKFHLHRESRRAVGSGQPPMEHAVFVAATSASPANEGSRLSEPSAPSARLDAHADDPLLSYTSTGELDALWGTIAGDPHALQVAQSIVATSEAMIAEVDPHIRDDIADFNRRLAVTQLRSIAHLVDSAGR